MLDISTDGLINNASAERFSSTGFYNPLHDYSSYNYVITWAAITEEQANSTSFFHSSPSLDYIILKTSGKGDKGINLSSAVLAGQDVVTSASDPNKWDNVPDARATRVSDELAGILKEFNATGPGRFDFFVDKLEMNGPLFVVEGATGQDITMTVIEPLSMNSLLESIRINALAAGWEFHQGAHFCIKVEFWGWHDKTGKVEKVPKAERYLHVNISSANTTFDERGTVHTFVMTSLNTFGYGLDGETPTTIKMVGETVKEMLTDFMKSVTEEWKRSNGSEHPEIFNEYAIEFLPWKGPGPGDSFNGKDPGGDDCKINSDRLRSNQSFEFSKQGSKTKKDAYQYVNGATGNPANPNNETITVKSGSKIAEIVETVVRDSEYTRWFIDNKEELKTKWNGLVPWYRVAVRVETKPKINPKEQRLAYKFFYQVRPFWIHFSALPEEFGKWDTTDILRTISRSYNYWYSGKNVDIISFDFQVNSMYTMDRPYRLGDQDRSGASMAAAPGNSTKKEIADQTTPDSTDPQNTAPAKAGTVAAVPIYGSSKGIQLTPYQAIAASIQSQLINSMGYEQMDLKIIGDPYYLVSTGFGNSVSELETQSQNKLGEAPWLDEAVYISIDFKNPLDYRSDGFMDFGQDKIDHFSGLFFITDVSNIFKDGEFTQRLKLTRCAGQQPNKTPVKAIPFISTPKEGDQTTKDSAPASVNKFGSKRQTADLSKILNPQIPSLGLAGLMASAQGLFAQTSGALQSSVKRIDAAIADGLGVIQGVVAPLQAIASVGAQIGGLVAVADALLNNPGAPAVGQTLTGYNPYTSGIPLQTTTIPAPSKTAQNQANQNAQANIISSFVQDTNNLYTLETNYKNNIITADGKNYITNPSKDSNLNNIGQKTIAALNGVPTDPTAIAAQLGIDPAQFSGLSTDQQTSLLSKLQKVLASVPKDANIQGFQALGLSLKNLTGAGIANLPALQALTKSPLANVSQYDLQKILANGGNIANLPGASSFASVGALLALLGGSRGQANGTGGSNPLNATQQFDKFRSAAELNNASLNTNGLPPAVQGLGSVESNNANAIRTLQGIGGYYVETNTVNSLYGTQRALSPLDKLMLTKTS
jgi:hypothetical protein